MLEEINNIKSSLEIADLSKVKFYLNKNNINIVYELGYIFEFFDCEPKYKPILEYLLSIGFNSNTLYEGLTLIFEYIYCEKESNEQAGLMLDESNIKLLVKYGANINYVGNYINSSNIKTYINKSNKITPLDYAIFLSHKPAKEYLLSLGAKTARELEKEEILSKEKRNEYEELLYNCFKGDLDKVKNQIKTEYEKGFEGYIYSPIIASLESNNQELMSFLLKYTIDIIFSNEENKVKFQDKNLFRTYLRNLFYESYLKYHEKIMEIYKMNFENISED